MPDFESAPISNKPLNTTEAGVSFNPNEVNPTTEVLGELKIEKIEQDAEKELSLEEQIQEIAGKSEVGQKEIERLTEYVESTKSQINEIRANLGMPPTDEDPPSILSEKERIEKLKAEKEELDRQKEKIINQQEKEQLIREEKERILQERLNQLLREIEALSPRDFGSILNNGKTEAGYTFKSQTMGELGPDTAKILAKATREQIKLLPEILKILPDLMDEFDADITKEATERVERKLKEEKQKLLEEELKNQQEEESGKEDVNKPEEITLDKKSQEVPVVEMLSEKVD